MKNVIRKLILAFVMALLVTMSSFGKEGLEVHFIDVGQADAALVLCDDHAMMIDGGNSEDSQLIYAYLQNHSVTSLDYIICSHDDADHVGGLSAAVSYAGTNIGSAFAPYTDSTKERFQTFKRKLAENGKTIQVPTAGETYPLGNATIQILSSAGGGEANLTLRLTYGKTSFLFMGDADETLEKQIISSGLALESSVLKVGHHGSKNSSCYQFIRAVNPAYAIIDVGKGNSYGHPTEETLSKLRDAGTLVYRTDNNGTVIFTSDGNTISVRTEKEFSQETNLIAGSAAEIAASAVAAVEAASVIPSSEEKGTTQTYILNINSRKFHLPGCSAVKKMKEKNKLIVENTREEIISQGYDPCKICNP